MNGLLSWLTDATEQLKDDQYADGINDAGQRGAHSKHLKVGSGENLWDGHELVAMLGVRCNITADNLEQMQVNFDLCAAHSKAVR